MLKIFRQPLIRQYSRTSAQAGFSLLELSIVVAILGILATIAVPSWLAFTRQQRVNRYQQTIVNLLETAQRRAKNEKTSYSISFRTSNRVPQYALHPDNVRVRSLPAINWRTLEATPEGPPVTARPNQVLLYTNLLPNTNDFTRNNVRTTPISYIETRPVTITFSETGGLRQDINPAPNLGANGLIIAVASPRNGYTLPVSRTRRCVSIRTLNGLIQTETGRMCP